MLYCCVAVCCSFFFDMLHVIWRDDTHIMPQQTRLQHSVAVCCSVLQCTAVSCSVAACFSVFQRVAVCACRRYGNSRHDCHKVLQCVAVCCSVLQRVAVSCSVMQ